MIIIDKEGIHLQYYLEKVKVITLEVESPMAAIDPNQVEYIIKMSRIGDV